MEIGIGSKVKVTETAVLQFCRGLVGVVVGRNEDLFIVDFDPADFPTNNRSINRNRAQRSFWKNELDKIPDNRLLDWLRR